ncbi:ChbG/HpnK family deacetylase [Salinarimonas chemoclinalis]|uniref:ChbG/HpnK family deacetylase n=1 Tax=Salinarimonas chemoclinalis TaxID=3241599 RepID=UPI003558BB68
MTRSIVVMAEDYGIAHGVCDAALDLVAMGRISAIAARSGGPVFATRAAELAVMPRSIGVGLALDLADGRPAAFLARAIAGRLDRDALVGRIRAQVESFAQAVGRAPDFVGAPGEVHVAPGVRGALLHALDAQGLAGAAWLRDPSERLSARLRRGTGLVRASGAHALARGFAAGARRRGYGVNRGYAGFLPATRDLAIPAAYERLAQAPGPAPLLVVRPAYPDATLEAQDRLAERRGRELFYLSSTRFSDLMEVLSWRLVPAPEGAWR